MRPILHRRASQLLRNRVESKSITTHVFKFPNPTLVPLLRVISASSAASVEPSTKSPNPGPSLSDCEKDDSRELEEGVVEEEGREGAAVARVRWAIGEWAAGRKDGLGMGAV